MSIRLFPHAAPRAGAETAYAERGWRSADGLDLHARDYAAASGPARLPVICIHGLTRNARDFEELAPVLAAGGRRVLAVDVRGRGLSAHDPNPRNYHPAVYAADMAALMAALGLARAHFIGTSMGGLVAMALASMKPELVAGAILNDVGAELAPEGLARIGQYVGQPAPVQDWGQATAYAQRQNTLAFPHYGPEQWRRMARRLFREDASGRPVLDYDPAIVESMKDSGRDAADLWPLWSALTKKRPVLVIRGGNSDLLAAATLERMRNRAPAIESVEVPGVGHAPMLDEPAALEAVQAFFATHP